MNTVMTMQEAEESIQKLREIFDVVRLLDAEVIENINRKNDTGSESGSRSVFFLLEERSSL